MLEQKGWSQTIETPTRRSLRISFPIISPPVPQPRQTMVLLQPPRIFIPDLLARWPSPRRINPHYATVGKDSAAWATTFRVFSPKAQRAFERCDFSNSFPPPTLTPCLVDLLACLSYPMARKSK